jgi:hypothetical protein
LPTATPISSERANHPVDRGDNRSRVTNVHAFATFGLFLFGLC